MRTDDISDWIGLGWPVGQLTGWGQYGVGLVRGLWGAGQQVVLAGGWEPAGVGPVDRLWLSRLACELPEGRGWMVMPLGNGMEARPERLPDGVRCAGLVVFEDPGALTAEAVERLRAYDALVAPSRWVAGMLADAGIAEVPVCHQGYDERVFFPRPRERQGGLRVFSGGKLEFRKAQDIAVEAFKRFRALPEGREAVLVCAWDNPWPLTMDGIWLSGYVKGAPAIRGGKADVTGWLAKNGVPSDAVVDCGKMSQPELAQALRSCDVGVFPSRAEGATNMVLVEALSTGLPCLASSGHGHEDVMPNLLPTHSVVPQGCRLVRSTDGWRETDPDVIVEGLVAVARGEYEAQTISPAYWGWDHRAPALWEAIRVQNRQPALVAT